MKGIIYKASGEREVKDFAAPLYKSLGIAVGGWIEVVHPHGLPHPYCLVCNEEGLLLNLPFNAVGAKLYGFPMVGDIVIMKEGFTDEGPDLVGLDDEDIKRIEELTK